MRLKLCCRTGCCLVVFFRSVLRLLVAVFSINSAAGLHNRGAFLLLTGMESENSMQRNIKKEEGEGFRDILNEAVNQGQRLDDEQFKTHILKTTEVKLEQKFPGCEVKLEQKFPGCAIKVKPPICDEEVRNSLSYGL